MQTINIHEAKTHFSMLVNAAMHGEETIIAKSGIPVAKLVPIQKSIVKRKRGVLKGKIKIAKDFDALLPDDILNSFDGYL